MRKNLKEARQRAGMTHDHMKHMAALAEEMDGAYVALHGMGN